MVNETMEDKLSAFRTKIESNAGKIWQELNNGEVPASTWKNFVVMTSPYIWIGLVGVFLGKPENVGIF